jgi:MFS family permease
VAAAIGPFLGGWLVTVATWRLVFFINLPLAAVVVWLASAHVPESRDPAAAPGVDAGGAALAAAGLAGVVYALIEGPERAWSWPVVAAGAGGVVALALFAVVERRSRHPMLSYEAFASTQFSVVNLITFLIYGALSGSLFLLPIQLQRVLGWSPVAAGTALVPFTVLMLLLSARVGRLAQRIGPRLPMTVGPLLAAAGLVLFARVGPGATYLGAVLPAVLVFGLGMTITVAPLTAAVLAAAPAEHAGAASGINNAVARTAGLLAVAVLPPLAGVSGPRALDPAVLTAGFRHAVLIAAGLVAAGGLVALATVRRPAAPAPTAAHATKPCCPVDAPPLRRPPAPALKP